MVTPFTIDIADTVLADLAVWVAALEV